MYTGIEGAALPVCVRLSISSAQSQRVVLTAVGLEAREVYTFLWWTYIGITIIFVFTENVDDFVNPSPSTLTFPEGSLVGDTQCTNIGLVPDDVVEGTESFSSSSKSQGIYLTQESRSSPS